MSYLEAATREGFYNTSAASWGQQAGGKQFSYALFLMTDRALGYLHDSAGWAIGAGGNIAVIDRGAAAAAILGLISAYEGRRHVHLGWSLTADPLRSVVQQTLNPLLMAGDDMAGGAALGGSGERLGSNRARYRRGIGDANYGVENSKKLK